MPKTPKKSRLRTNKHKPKFEQEVNINKSNLPPNLQSFKQKTSLRLRFFSIKMSLEDFQFLDNEPIDDSII